MAFLGLIPLIAESVVLGTGGATMGAEAIAIIATMAKGIAELEGAKRTGGMFTAKAETASKLPVFDMTANGTTPGANAVRQAITEGSVSFGKFAAAEASKQAVFYAAMKSTELMLHHTAEDSSDPVLITLAAKVQKINEALAALHTATSDWIHWSAAHYHNRASYGSLEVSGGSVMRFEVLQFNISALTDMLHSEDAPVLVDFHKSNTAGDLDTLRSKLLNYCQNVKSQSDSIAGSDQAMVADGLQPHQDDIAKALAALS